MCVINIRPDSFHKSTHFLFLNYTTNQNKRRKKRIYLKPNNEAVIPRQHIPKPIAIDFIIWPPSVRGFFILEYKSLKEEEDDELRGVFFLGDFPILELNFLKPFWSIFDERVQTQMQPQI